MSGKLDIQALRKYANAFVLYEVAAHGVNPKDTLDGTDIKLKNREGYKMDVYDSCRKSLNAGGPYVEKIMEFLPGGNLVDHHQKKVLEQRMLQYGKEAAESALKLLYEGNDDEKAFYSIKECFGGFFDVIGFLFFLKDSSKYLPIRSSNFDLRFEKLGWESKLEGNSTWDKYVEYINLVKEVQRFLCGAVNTSFTRLDAHSFLWIMPYLEEYIDSGMQIVEHKKFGQGVVTGTKDDYLIVRFGKTEKSFSIDNAYDYLIPVPLEHDIYSKEDSLEDKELEELLVEEKSGTQKNQTAKIYAADIPITSNGWKNLICDPDVFKNSDVELMKRIYLEADHATTCYDLGLKDGVSSSAYISPVVALARRISERENLDAIYREDGSRVWWRILFQGKEREDGHFEWKLIPNLIKALETVYPELITSPANSAADSDLITELKTATLAGVAEQFCHKGLPKDKAEKQMSSAHMVYPRDRQTAINALAHADFSCEIDKQHPTFIRKNSDKCYTEPHHLVPMAYSDEFTVSLDVEENIVSLCSNCHNEIHYGRDAEKLIIKLYEERSEALKKVNIDITLKELLKMYGID